MKSGINWYNNKVFQFFDYVFRLVLINFLIIIPSFLILYLFSYLFGSDSYFLLLGLIPIFFYLYPAIVAGTDLIRAYELKIHKDVFKEFFKSFKKYYLKALLESVFIIVLFVLFYNSISYFYKAFFTDGGAIINLVGFLLSSAFAVMIACIILHLPLVATYMEGCRTIDDVKLATMMAFKDLPITLGLAVVIIAFEIITFAVEPTKTLLIIGGASFPIYAVVKLTFKKYFVIYVRSEKRKQRREEKKNENE